MNDKYELTTINDIFDLPSHVDLDELFDSMKLSIVSARLVADQLGVKPSTLLEESITFVDDGKVSGSAKSHDGKGITVEVKR